MATCDLIEVDLSPHDFTVELNPVCYDVGIITSQVTLDYGLIAGSGPPGAPGEKGDKGDKGDTGQPGSPGLAAYVTVGTTTTGAPGTSAVVTDSDPSDNATLNFLIPRGDVGATGPMGQGIVIKGSVANHAALPATGNSPGDTWVTTDTGHGWSWNGSAWVDIGPIQGPPGTTGAQGPPGATGAPGSAGAPGAAATVAAGPTVTGAPGSNANVLNTGTSSAAIFAFTIPRGDVGATGSAGAQGAQGPTGATGATGPQGNPGSTGSTGPQGPAGPTAVSTDAGNIAVLGSDAKIFVPQAVPTGTVLDFAGASAPSGFLICNGASYATASYPTLFTAIGYVFGGSGANFNVPDCRGRTTIGAGQGTGLTNRALAATGGEETHVLLLAELASHTHGYSGAQYIGSGGNTNPAGGTAWNMGISTPTDPTGSNTAHNNIPPFIVFNRIIKT